MRLEDLEIDTRIIEILRKDGIESMFPPQEDAVNKGVLDGKNLVVAVPTASGKTLIAELAMLTGLLNRGKKALYLAPLRALASEKYNEFQRFAEKLDLRVGISTGALDSRSNWLGRYDIIVTTNEKMDSILRHAADWVSDIGTIIADEVHLVNDPGRGPTLEVVLARLRELLPEAQVIALSATIRNANEIAGWLDAELVYDEWRPVDLREGVFFEDYINFGDGKSSQHKAGSIPPTISLAVDAVAQGGQSLIFGNSRRSVVSLAKKAADQLIRRLSAKQKRELALLSDLVRSEGEVTELTKNLAIVLKSGVAFHHAGLTDVQRSRVEQAFKENMLKIVTATPTLAAGVNLPARRVVIDSLKRYYGELGRMMPIPVLEYKQMAGRAGRPKYDTYGEAITVARSYGEGEEIKDYFILGEPEDIESRLASVTALRAHVLAAIATELVSTSEELLSFVSNTFYGHLYSAHTVVPTLQQVTRYLAENNLIVIEGDFLTATDFGRVVSDTYIDPLSAVIIKNGLERADELEDEHVTELGLFTLLSSTPNMITFSLKSKEKMQYVMVSQDHEEELLGEPPLEPEDYETHLGHLKVALLMCGWIAEKSDARLYEEFGTQSGDLHNKVRATSWLLQAAHSIAQLFEYEGPLELIKPLRLRVKHGVRKQLLPLVQLKGIGRVRARSMYRAGLKTTEDIAKAPIHQIARAAGIGKTLARSLKEQLGVENPDTPEDYLAAEFQSQATRPASGNLKAVLSRMAENPDTTNKPTTATSSTPADDDDEREMPPKRRKPKGALDRFLSE